MILYEAVERLGLRGLLRSIYRMEIEGAESIPAVGPCILVANHESLIDPFVLGAATARKVRYMAKAELFRYPLLRHVMGGFGSFPVERNSGDEAAIGQAGELLAQGEVLGIFPQGTCLPYRERPWRRGAARIALATGAPLVPVCLVGTEKALRPHRPKIGLPELLVRIAEPIEVTRETPTREAAAALIARVEGIIEELHRPYGPPAHVWLDGRPRSSGRPV
jgi:1-acyl-sn-glycerol-3-phosphate acyltransferase